MTRLQDSLAPKLLCNASFLREPRARCRCWNDNSPDTGGVVGADWSGIDWRKVAFMQRIGLRPWYA